MGMDLPYFSRLLRTLKISIAIVMFLSGCRSVESSANANQSEAVAVKLLTIQNRTVRDSSEFIANLESRQSVDLRSRVPGQVSRILVQPGDVVRVGTPILQIDAAQQQAVIDNALADAESAQAELENAKATLKTYQAQRLERVANLEFNRQQYQRFASLQADGAVSQQTLAEYRNRLATAEAGLGAIDAQIEAQQAAISRTERAAQGAQARIQQQRVQLQYFTIAAPFTGSVGEIPVKVGDVVEATTHLATLTQNNALEVNISIPANRAQDIRIGTPIELTDGKGQSIGTSRIFFISPTMKDATQSLLVKARLSNANQQLRADKFIRARVIWEEQPGIVIPTTAVSRIAGQSYVFVVEQTGSGRVARQKPVQLGTIEGNHYRVLKGLNPGEQIITTGLMQLFDGAAIVSES
jgi:multidrug efflux pump subunit AcrA (membrane-fusion protein)